VDAHSVAASARGIYSRLHHTRRSFPAERVVNEFEDLAMLGATDFGFVDEDFVDRGLSQVEDLAEAYNSKKAGKSLFRGEILRVNQGGRCLQHQR